MDGAEPAENMEVNSSENSENLSSSTNGNITLDNTDFSNEDTNSNHIEQTMEFDATEKSDKLSNDIYNNITADSTVLANEGNHESQTEQNMEVDSVMDHDVLQNDKFASVNSNNILSPKDLEAKYEIIQMNSIILANEGDHESQTEQNMEVDSVIDHDLLLNDKFTSVKSNNILSPKNLEAKYEIIQIKSIETLEQTKSTINKTEVETFDQPIEKVIDMSNVKTSELSISNKIHEFTNDSSVQPIKENLVNSSNQLFETLVSSSDTNFSKPLVKEIVLNSVSETSDQQIKKNICIKSDKSTVNGDQTDDNTTIMPDPTDQNISESDVETSVKLPESLVEEIVLNSVSEMSDQQMKNNICIKSDKSTVNDDQTGDNTTIVPDPIDQNISDSDVETSVKLSEPLVEEIVLNSVSETSDQQIKKNICIKSDKLTVNDDQTGDNTIIVSDPIDENISESDVETSVKLSEPLVEEIVLNSISETSDQQIKKNNCIKSDKSTVNDNQRGDNATIVSDPIDENISESNVETSVKLIEKNISGSDDHTVNKATILSVPICENISVSNAEIFDQPINMNTSGSDDQTDNTTTILSDPIYENISVSDVETSDQPINMNTSESDDQIDNKTTILSDPIYKNISVSDVKTSEQPTKEKIDESSDRLIKKTISVPDFKISEQQSKKINSASTVGNILRNTKLPMSPLKTDYLNLDKIAIPKTVMCNVNSKQSSVLSGQIKKVQPITIVSGNSSFLRIQPKLYSTENNALKPNQEIKIVSSNESKPGVLLVPHNGMKYVVKKMRKEELNNKLLKSSSMSSAIKLNSTEFPQSPEKNRKFVTLLEKCPNGTFKMVQSANTVGCNEKKANNFIIKTEKQPISVKYLNANGLRLIPQKSNMSLGSTSLSNFCTIKKDVRLIPHTVTSKDLIENKTKTVFESTKKISTNTNQEMCNSSNVHLTSKPEYLSQQALKPLKIGNIGKVTQNDGKKFQFLSMKSIDKSRLNISSQTNVKHLIPTVIQNDENFSTSNKSTDGIIEVYSNEISTSKDGYSYRKVEKTSNKNKMSFTTGNIKKKRKILLEGSNSTSNLASCGHEDCDAMVFESELVDDMYCSVDCKKLSGNKITLKFPPPPPMPTKPVVDRKAMLLKLQNSIRLRRKQKLLLLKGSEQSEPDYVPNPSENSFIKQTNDIDTLNKIEDVSNIPKISELSDFSGAETLGKSTIERQEYHEPTSYSKVNIPMVSQLADEAYLKSIEEGKQILSYVKKKDFKSAPKKLFDRPFPVENNSFKVNQKLEGIDPEHETLFCVLSVAEIQGYRLKLHFDGYSDDHDFWVNADCPNIFHVKWCEEHSRTLQPPYNYEEPFEWSTYLRDNHAFPAPKSNFTSSVNTTYFKNHKFHIGAKLEALDKVTRTLPKQLICVATVADILGGRIRIHFDGWSKDFDYWTCISSSNLHPIGWCENNGRVLTPPCGYNDFKGKKRFSWTEYLKETNSEPVPEDAFIRSPLREFTIGMAIEVVDLVVPSLIRVAKVIDVKDNEIKILYDGFHPNYSYWVEDDSPDIHPIGWCFKTHHPLEIPPESSIWSCKVAGCNGKGNLYDYQTDHVNPKDCPYELDSWKKSVNGLLKVPDRLNPSETTKFSISTKNSKSRKIENQEKENIKKDISFKIEPQVFAEPKYHINNEKKSYEELATTNEVINRTCDVFHKLKIKNCYKLPTLATIGMRYTRYKMLGEATLFTSDPRKWTVKEVAECADKAVRNDHTQDSFIASHYFIDHEIDGESFLMLTKNDLLRSLQLPLGPAVKIYHTIKLLQEKSVLFNNITL